MLARVTGPAVVALVVLGVWTTVAEFTSVPSTSLPGPMAVVAALWEQRDIVADATLVTLAEIGLGFGLAVVVGLVSALTMHRVPWLARGVYPWLVVSQLVPLIAIAPLFVIWFGFGIEAKAMLVALVSFFPITVNALDGLRSTDPDLVRVLRTLGASRGAVFWLAEWPTALPAALSGLKIGSALAVIGAVFAEWVGSDNGLGYLILTYNNQLETAEMFAAVAALAALGLALFGGLTVLERRIVPWSGR